MSVATPPYTAGEAEYEAWARVELAHWRERVLKPPGALDRAATGLQGRVNRLVPEKVHVAVSKAIEQLTRGILAGSDWTTAGPLAATPLAGRDRRAAAAIAAYRTTATVEGGVTGAGGFLMAAADFPALLAIKIKLLFELAAIYGHATDAFAERLYLLRIFELAFSSAAHRAEVFRGLEDWDARPHPDSFDAFDWRTFQQQYRDYIDLAKLAQMVPVIGAPVGAVANYRLLDRLGETAVNAYRLRWLA